MGIQFNHELNGNYIKLGTGAKENSKCHACGRVWHWIEDPECKEFGKGRNDSRITKPDHHKAISNDASHIRNRINRSSTQNQAGERVVQFSRNVNNSMCEGTDHPGPTRQYFNNK